MKRPRGFGVFILKPEGIRAVVVGAEFQGFIPSAGGFQPDDLSPDINGGLLNADARDVAAVVMSLLE